jgi:hypothetical protein
VFGLKKITSSTALFLISVLLAAILMSSHVLAEDNDGAADYAGTWQGSIDVGHGMSLPLVFHLKQADSKYAGTFDSPMQGSSGTQFDSVVVDSSGKVAAHFAKTSIIYSGTLAADKESIVGTFTQGGVPFALTLQRVDTYHGPNRPQEPKPPFPYKSEDIKFENGSVTINGTLTVPEGSGPFPAVVLVHGSGPHDRDETIFLHKPFLVLADCLTRHGIAVLRYDKRGCGKSTGDYNAATIRDFASDAAKAVAFLQTRPDISAKKIGLIGHSEGGVVAPMVAVENPQVDFIVMMAGSVFPGDIILLGQVKALAESQKAAKETIDKDLEVSRQTYAIIKKEKDDDKAIAEIKALHVRLDASESAWTGSEKEAFAKKQDAQLRFMVGPWYRFFLSYDPRPTLEKVRCPVLALNGDKDTQVIAKDNLDAIKTCLAKGGNINLTIVELPGLNHLFQTCQSGYVGEYASIEETMSPKVLQTIVEWIDARVKSNGAL